MRDAINERDAVSSSVNSSMKAMKVMEVYDSVIIGGGTAGLTAALYALRGGLSVLLLEGGAPGGQIIASPAVDNFPGVPGISGVDFAQKLLSQVRAPGLVIKYQKVLEINSDKNSDIISVVTKKAVYQTRAVIWAAGVKANTLGCPGEEKFVGRGVSYCATCDGAFYRDKVAAVVGGGSSALTEALFLAGMCREVHLIHRRSDFRAEAILSEKVGSNDKIVLHMQTEVSEIIGGRRVEKLRLVTGGKEDELTIDGVFVAAGHRPENDILRGVAALDEQGYVIAGEDCRTEQPWLFVAGDCRQKPLRQLITAAADGAVAASGVIDYLRLKQGSR